MIRLGNLFKGNKTAQTKRGIQKEIEKITNLNYSQKEELIQKGYTNLSNQNIFEATEIIGQLSYLKIEPEDLIAGVMNYFLKNNS